MRTIVFASLLLGAILCGCQQQYIDPAFSDAYEAAWEKYSTSNVAAKPYALKAYDIAVANDNSQEISKAAYLMGLIEMQLKEIPEAYRYLLEAEANYVAIGNDLSTAKAQYLIARIQAKAGKSVEAEAQLLQCLEVFIDGKQTKDIANAYWQLAKLAKSKASPEQAEQYLQKVIEHATGGSILYYAYESLGKLKLAANDAAAAEEAFTQAMAAAEAMDSPLYRSYAASWLSVALYKQGEYTTAKTLAEDALALGQSSGRATRQLPTYHRNHALALMALGNLPAAQATLQGVPAMHAQLGNTEAWRKAMHTLVGVCTQLGDTEGASRYNALLTETDPNETIEAVQQRKLALMARLETVDAQREAQARAATQTHQGWRWVGYVTLALVVLGGLLLYVVLLEWRNMRRLNHYNVVKAHAARLVLLIELQRVLKEKGSFSHVKFFDFMSYTLPELEQKERDNFIEQHPLR